MKATLEVINRMQSDGVIGKYAIGGAVGATFYLEPSATLDIDVFVSFQTAPGSSLITIAPVYTYLTSHGFAGSGLQPEPFVNVLRSFVNPLVQSARLNQLQQAMPGHKRDTDALLVVALDAESAREAIEAKGLDDT